MMQSLARSLRLLLHPCGNGVAACSWTSAVGPAAAPALSAAASQPSLSSPPWRTITTSPASRGLEEFFDTPGKDGAPPPAGRSWMARELRLKSWDDLHKLWYVLLKERNMLQSEKLRAKAAQVKMLNPTRCSKVRKSMARLKHVLSERALSQKDVTLKRDLKAFIDAI